MDGKQLAFMTFHTAFLPAPQPSTAGESLVELTFTKEEIDGAYTQPESKIARDFKISLSIRDPSLDAMAVGAPTPKSVPTSPTKVEPSSSSQPESSEAGGSKHTLPPLPQVEIAPSPARPSVFRSQVASQCLAAWKCLSYAKAFWKHLRS